MCIYCGTANYRKIYENHQGPIPKDIDGRSYDIHHIDGNHSNNTPNNLIAVTIEEHYKIHYSNREYGACFKMAYRMNLTPMELSELAKQQALEKVRNGTHPWAGPNAISTRKAKEGTHHWQNGNNPIYNKTKQELSEIATLTNLNRVAKGTHPSLIKVSCLCCKKSIGMTGFSQHYPKCNSLKKRT